LFEIIFLGTSASAPSINRNLSAQVITHNEYRFLLDCGEGTQRQILQAGLGFRRLNRILITHHHLDHILGLGGLISTFMRWETVDELEIMAAPTALERIHTLIYGVVLGRNRPEIDIRLTEIQPGVIFDDQDFRVSAFPVTHRGPDCLGYIFEEKTKRPFLAKEAELLGIPPGPCRRDLVEGKSILLADGREICPEDVLGEEQLGAKIVFSGDVGDTDCLRAAARNADVLVCESTYLDEEADIAYEFGHLTSHQAASLAASENVKKLVLTHISRRYREKDVMEEARKFFTNSYVARDFDVYQVKHEPI